MEVFLGVAVLTTKGPYYCVTTQSSTKYVKL